MWKIETFAQSGDTLLMEGWRSTDTTNGNRVMNRYMGAMEFRDGKIARWRDYFQLNRPPAAWAGATAGADAYDSQHLAAEYRASGAWSEQRIGDLFASSAAVEPAR